MGRRIGSGLLAAAVAVAIAAAGAPTGGAASKRHAPACAVTNAGGSPNSAAAHLGGWGYDVDFSCPYKISSFTVRTNKHLRSGTDIGGIAVPWANSQLANGQQVNFACKSSGAKSFKCTLSPALPARLPITDGFDASKCTNTSRGDLQFSLSVNGKRTRASFNGKTTTGGSLTGGCG